MTQKKREQTAGLTAPPRRAFITSGAALCRALRENFTGEGKLEIIRNGLVKNPNMTAEEAYALLESEPQVTQRTLDKARGLIDAGKVPDVEGVGGQVNLEDIILADRRHLEALGYQRPKPAEETAPPPPTPVKSEADIRAEVEAEMRAKLEAELKSRLEADRQAATDASSQAALERAELERKATEEREAANRGGTAADGRKPVPPPPNPPAPGNKANNTK